jgi:uncharacterized protein DUF4915
MEIQAIWNQFPADHCPLSGESLRGTDEKKPPFGFTYTPEVADLLAQLGCSLAFSTYQAGKVVFLIAPAPGRLNQLPRTFNRPMGLAVSEGRLAVATYRTVEVLANCPSLAPT